MSRLPIVTLQRTKATADSMLGEMYDERGRREGATVELAWKNNERMVSCIPAGEYIAERYLSPKHNRVVFRLINVPDRDDCEIHPANLSCELLGCIAIGLEHGEVTIADGRSGLGVVGSKSAFLAFMANHPEQRFTLSVLDPFPSLPEHPL